MNTNQATYSPEDNKLRLYVGRVPREEFLKLRAEGWTTLHKQREAGGGDFVAVWTPSRRDTALEYGGGVILDEDMGPAERAADRAERFGGYRDKRTAEACGHADKYEAGPVAHGFQDVKKAERAVSRHEKIGDRATDAWSKAEYWTRRTEGVISHALYVSSPGVRMGRIKELEADLRKQRASLDEYGKLWRDMQKIAAMTDGAEQTKAALHYCGSRHIWAEYIHPRAEQLPEGNYHKTNKTSLYSLLSDDVLPITGAEACALFFSDHCEPKADNDWTIHLTLRLAYENQMLQAQGGRAAHVEMLPGGKLYGKLIVKVCKSNVTGRVVSVFVKGEKVNGWQYKTRNVAGTDYSLHQFETERLPADAYTPPTAETLAELAALVAERKSKAPKKAPCPLINPTDADAQRLQDLWNERARADYAENLRKQYISEAIVESSLNEWKPSTVCRITQAVYSANSKGAYSSAETRGVKADGYRERRASNMYSSSGAEYDKRTGPAVCQVRITSGDGSTTFNKAPRVIILTDKPQKPLPSAVWEKYVAPVTGEIVPCPAGGYESNKYTGKSRGLSYTVNG